MAAVAKDVGRYARGRHALSAAVRQRRRRLHAGDQALASLRAGDGAARTALARFFAENIAVQGSGLERSVTEGAESINNAQPRWRNNHDRPRHCHRRTARSAPSE